MIVLPGRLALPAGYLQRVDHQLSTGVVGDRPPHDPAAGWSRHSENPDRDIFSAPQATDTAVLASGSSWTHRNPMLGGCSPGQNRPRLVSRPRLPLPVHGSCAAPRSAHDARHWSGFGSAGVSALGHRHLKIGVRKNGSGSSGVAMGSKCIHPLDGFLDGQVLQNEVGHAVIIRSWAVGKSSYFMLSAPVIASRTYPL